MGIKNVTVQNMVLADGNYSERIIGYDFNRGAYAVLSDTIDFYTEEELKERFELTPKEIVILEAMFDY